jgi:hypothetical protein
VEEAAESARIRPETLWRWLAQDVAFQQALKQERRQQREAACIAAEALMGLAVETLEKVMRDETLEPEVRVEAARTTFEVAMQLYKLTVLEDRLVALEARWKEQEADSQTGGELQQNAAAAAKRVA